MTEEPACPPRRDLENLRFGYLDFKMLAPKTEFLLMSSAAIDFICFFALSAQNETADISLKSFFGCNSRYSFRSKVTKSSF